MLNAAFKLSWCAVEVNDLARARSLLERSLAISQELDNPRQTAYILHSMADLARVEGDLVRARALYEQTADRQRRLGMVTLRIVLVDLGCVLIQFGELDRSREVPRESLSLDLELGASVGSVMAAFAFLANARADPRRATRLLGAAEALRASSGEHMAAEGRVDYERNLASLHAQLDQATFEAAWAEGAALTPEQAVALAMSEDP
jgi:hypothetical protein